MPPTAPALGLDCRTWTDRVLPSAHARPTCIMTLALSQVVCIHIVCEATGKDAKGVGVAEGWFCSYTRVVNARMTARGTWQTCSRRSRMRCSSRRARSTCHYMYTTSGHDQIRLRSKQQYVRKASGESGIARCQRSTAASVRSVVSAVRSTLRSRSRGVACVGEKTWPCPAGRGRPSEDVGDNNVAVCCVGGTSPRSSGLASRCLSSDSKPLLPCIEVPLSSVL